MRRRADSAGDLRRSRGARKGALAALIVSLAAAAILAGASGAGAASPSVCGATGVLSGTNPLTCTYSTIGSDVFTVPAGVSQAGFTVVGAQGGQVFISGAMTAQCAATSNIVGTPGGNGGEATGTTPLTPGQTLQIDVAGKGANGTAASRCGGMGNGPSGGSGAIGGFGGSNGGVAGGPGDAPGANGGTAFNGGNGSGGGGSSDVRLAPAGCAALTCDPSTRVLVAAGGGGDGGGGGSGAAAGGSGGAGGGASGVMGGPASGGGAGASGGGGSQSVGGAPGLNPARHVAGQDPSDPRLGHDGAMGALGAGGLGGDGNTPLPPSLTSGGAAGGGAGGGYFGGGGGGGGSSFFAPSATNGGLTSGANTGSINSGNGQVTVTFVPGTLITGTVTNASGTGLPNVCVYPFDAATGSRTVDAAACTDGSGNYTLSVAAAGSYDLVFYDSTGAYVTQWYTGAAYEGLATPVSVTAATTTPGINAVLASSTAAAATGVTGTVTDASGAGVANVCVYPFDAATGSRTADPAACTNAAGVYSLAVPAGSYNLVFYDATGSFVTQWYNGVPYEGGATPVTVSSGAVTSGIDAVSASAAEITGTVTDASGHPLANICVYPFDAGTGNRTADPAACTNAAGTYTLAVPAGSYNVVFYDASGVYATQWYDGAPFEGGATPVAVVGGAATTGIDATLPPV